MPQAIVKKKISPELTVDTILVKDGKFYIKSGCKKQEVEHVLRHPIYRWKKTKVKSPNYVLAETVESPSMKDWFILVE